MEKHDALIGGESSGGLTIRGHISGKDGIFAATLLVEMIAITKKSISEMIRELYLRYGSFFNQERDYSFTDKKKTDMQALLFEAKEIPNFKLEIENTSYMDGVKVYFKDGSWVSARFSGTEPLMRIFSEAKTHQDSIELVQAFETFLAIHPN